MALDPKKTTSAPVVKKEEEKPAVAEVPVVEVPAATPGSVGNETPEESALRHGLTEVHTKDVYQIPSSTHVHPDLVVELQATGKKIENPYKDFDFAPDAKFSERDAAPVTEATSFTNDVDE